MKIMSQWEYINIEKHTIATNRYIHTCDSVIPGLNMPKKVKEKRCHFFSRTTAVTLKDVDFSCVLNEVHQGTSKQQEYFYSLTYEHNSLFLPS